MLNISVQCRKSKTTSKGVARVEVTVNDGVRRSVMATDYTYNPILWEKETKMKRDTQAKRIADAVRDDINSRIMRLRSHNIPISTDNIKNIEKILYRKTTHDLKKEYLDILKPRVGDDLTFSQYRKYEQVLTDIANIDKDIENITISDIENIFFSYQKRYKASTLAGYTAKIKTIVTYAYNRGYISHNPSSSLKVKKTPENVRTMSASEYATIKTKQFNDRLSKIRDGIIFMCNTGLSYIDFTSFNPEHITEKNGIHIYQGKRHKTGIEYTTAILPDGLEILKKYDYNITPLKLSNCKYNAYMKEIQDICNISVNLTCHKCRHYFARNLLKLGLPLPAIQKMLGHSSVTTTQHYTKLLEKENADFIANALSQVYRKAE